MIGQNFARAVIDFDGAGSAHRIGTQAEVVRKNYAGSSKVVQVLTAGIVDYLALRFWGQKLLKMKS